MPDPSQPSFYSIDVEFADFINQHCVGKTITRAEPIDTECPVHAARIWFSDGTAIEIRGEHDEGFYAEWMESD